MVGKAKEMNALKYSDFFLKSISYLKFHVIGLGVSLAIAWSRLYYPQSPDLVERISFQGDDIPWMPRGFDAKPIIGNHYFGDLQLPLAYSRMGNPWTSDLEVRSNLTPLGKYILWPFSFLDLRIALAVYVTLSVILLYFSFRKLLHHLGIDVTSEMAPYYNLVFVLLFVITRPIAVDIDRGNFYTISISLLIIAVVHWQKGRLFFASLLIFIACGLKWFLIIPFLLLIGRKKAKELIFLLTGFAIANIAILSTVPGGIISNVKNLIEIQRQYGESWSIPYLMQTASLSSSISRVYEIINGTPKTVIFLTDNLMIFQTLTAMYVLIASLICLNRNIEPYIKWYFALSVISFGSLQSLWYAQGWISFVLIVWFSRQKNLKKDVIGGVTISLTGITFLIPTWINVPGIELSRYNQLLIFPSVLAMAWGIYLLFCLACQKNSWQPIRESRQF